MNADDVLQSSAHLAQHLRRAGVEFLPKADPAMAQRLAESFEAPELSEASPEAKTEQRRTAGESKPNAPPSKPTRRIDPVKPAGAVDGDYPGVTLPPGEREAFLTKLTDQVSQCRKCSALVQCRTRTVFGEGSVQPRFAFFGEGPGADEDRTGRPFVGRAGQLLTKMIEACTLKREDVYILNTVKCRPPGNRNPEFAEIENCRPYFEAQLSTLRPEYIVCLGAVAAQSLLKTKLSVGRLRGNLHNYFASKVVVTYHPAYLLRNPNAKKAAWDDLQMMLRDAGIQLPGR